VNIYQESPDAIELGRDSLGVLQAAFSAQADVSKRALQTSADFAALAFPTQIALSVVGRPVDEAYAAAGAPAPGSEEPFYKNPVVIGLFAVALLVVFTK